MGLQFDFTLGTVYAAPIATGILVLALVILSWIDIRTLRLPDWLTLPLAALGIGLSAFWGGIPGFYQSLIGAGIGYGVIWLLATYWRRSRGVDGIGLGDAKLLAAGGAWAGPYALPWILLVSSGLGLVFAGLAFVLDRNKSALAGAARIPFGPFLSLGIVFAWLVVQRPY
ncbi:MAG: A24 family peptidase [Pseudomonadota bacterium]